MFIYVIRNIKNGKRYVGQTIKQNPNDRWSAHKTELKKNRCNNLHLQRAWNKYGDKVWKYTIIDSAKTQKELNRLEEYYINFFDSQNVARGYNIRNGGSRGAHANSTKKKLSKISARFWKSTKGKNLKKYLATLAKNQKHSLAENIKRRNTLQKYEWINNIVKSPTGKYYTVFTIKGFCRQHNDLKQSSSHISELLRGAIQQHKGWKVI